MKNPDTKDGRAKRLVKFHLDVSRDDDFELMNYLKAWKGSRKLLPTIRNAMWLFISLLNGSLEMLMQMFPDAIKAIRSDLETKVSSLQSIVETQEAEIATLQKELSKRQPIQPELTPIQAQLERIERLMLQQGKPVNQDAQPPKMSDNKPIGLKALQPVAAGGPKPLAGARPLPPPPIEDEESDENLLEVKKDFSAAARTTQNFLKSILSLTEEQSKQPKPSGSNKALSKRQQRYMEG